MRVIASPLQRTQESAAPILAAFGLPIHLDERLIEPENRFEGKRMRGPGGALRDPRNWPSLVNPARPSWGEPFRSISARMLAAIDDAFHSVDDGDVVLVSHQLPIWMVHRTLAGERLAHDPRKRRCDLSSITTLACAATCPPRSATRAPPRPSWCRPTMWVQCEPPTAPPARRPSPASPLPPWPSTGCTTSDPLADQYRAGDGKGYIAGDGSVTEIPADERGDAVEFDRHPRRRLARSAPPTTPARCSWSTSGTPAAPRAAPRPPTCKEISEQFAGNGASFLGVNVRDQAASAIAFNESYEISYPSVMDVDDGGMQLAFSGSIPPNAVPTTLVLDSSGRVAARILGQVNSPSILETLIKDTIAEDG